MTDFNPTSLPNIKARIVITSVRGDTSSTIQLPFKTVEGAKLAQQVLSDERGKSLPIVIHHCAGKTILLHPEDIIVITLVDRLEEDHSRLIDTKYEKWLEDQTEEAQGKSTNFGIGR